MTSLPSVSEYAAVVARLIPATAVERVPLADALGLALAADLASPVALPPFDNSAMDGYAVRAADVAAAAADAPVRLPVAADVPAGRGDAPPLAPGTAHRIMTGAPVPPGADAIVPVEATDGRVDTVSITVAAEPGRHVRRAGEDVGRGAVVLAAGASLGPAQLGIAAASGHAALDVRRAPRVLVLSTGSELVEPGRPLAHGQVYESNGVTLAAAARQAGAVATVLRFVADDVDAFHAALAPALDGVDLVLTSGGVSAGAYEVVKDALAGHGVEFVKIAMQPGMPQGCGTYRGTPVVTLPGNPVSALVSFEVLVRPALRAAGGHTATGRPVVRAPLSAAAPLSSPAGRTQFRRGLLGADGAVSLVGGPGSHLLASFAASDCLVELGEDVTTVSPGDPVPARLLT